MNKMNSVWEKSGALFLLYSQKGNVIMFLGLRNAPMALKVGSVLLFKKNEKSFQKE